MAFLSFVALILASGSVLYVLSFYNEQNTEPFDCAVVFGAAVWPGGNPSHALADRTNTAIDRYEVGQVHCLIFSGADSAYDRHEVDVMRDIAEEREIDMTDIRFDYRGDNTRQTIENLNPEYSYLFISNDFHLARINLLARQAGLNDVGLYRSDYQRGRYTRETFFVFREVAAFWYYAFVTQ